MHIRRKKYCAGMNVLDQKDVTYSVKSFDEKLTGQILCLANYNSKMVTGYHST